MIGATPLFSVLVEAGARGSEGYVSVNKSTQVEQEKSVSEKKRVIDDRNTGKTRYSYAFLGDFSLV